MKILRHPKQNDCGSYPRFVYDAKGEDSEEGESIEEATVLLAKLVEWLVANGHSKEEISECMNYIAEIPPDEPPKRA